MSKIDLRSLIDNYFQTKEETTKQEIIDFLESVPLREINEVYFHDLVETKGKSITIAGELIRALNNIGYTWLNNNDVYFAGYGLEKVGSDAVYLTKYTNEIIKKMITSNYPEQYLLTNNKVAITNNFLKTLETRITQFIKMNPALMLTRNTVDCTKDFKNDAHELFSEYDEIINNGGGN